VVSRSIGNSALIRKQVCLSVLAQLDAGKRAQEDDS
jgi:hypothetical protein